MIQNRDPFWFQLFCEETENLEIPFNIEAEKSVTFYESMEEIVCMLLIPLDKIEGSPLVSNRILVLYWASLLLFLSIASWGK